MDSIKNLIINKILAASLVADFDARGEFITAFALHILKPMTEEDIAAWEQLESAALLIAKEENYVMRVNKRQLDVIFDIWFFKNHLPDFSIQNFIALFEKHAVEIEEKKPKDAPVTAKMQGGS